MRIDSPANLKIRAAAALRERRERDRTGLTLVDGVRESRRALESGVLIEVAFIGPGLVADGDRQIVDRLGDAAGERIELGRRAFARLAFGDRQDGVVLVVRQPSLELDRLALGPDPLLIVTEDVEKPGNLGAILRSADGAGADAVIVVGGTDLFNPNVIRASLGTVFSLPIAAAPAGQVRAWLVGRGLRIVATRVEAIVIYTDTNLTGSLAVVLGSEALGLSSAWTGPDAESVRVPMLGAADSLNVSATAAILLYEARRQRGLTRAPGHGSG